MTSDVPRWDLSNIFPGLESPEYEQASTHLRAEISELSELFRSRVNAASPEASLETLSKLVAEILERLNRTQALAETMDAYIYSFVSTDSFDALAKRRLSEFEQIKVDLRRCKTQFRAWLGRLEPRLDQITASNRVAEEHAFFLRESARQAKFLMSEVEETLAAELSLSGASAWEKLQGTVTSQLMIDFELDGEIRKLPLPSVINLHSHSDEEVRRRAYQAELEALESVREPLAACMNGVKGAVNVVSARRGRQDALHAALDQARIDRPTLEVMLEAIEASLPSFRSYFKAKARRLGKERLPWWDLYAPLGRNKRTYSFDEARSFILQNFNRFSPDLKDFAQEAFDRRWIDAEQRNGKRGGAFCMDLPLYRESRILCNFDGTLDQVTTIAHELGHAFHNHCAFQAGKQVLQRTTPMTLAETASKMCETIVLQAALDRAETAEEELSILDSILIGDSQTIVDIFSRYLFEKEVFERRLRAELSADELCEMMENAQKATYGDGLEPDHLNRYMWAWKPHYYSEELSFYNFPYAFGMLFGLGLYANYQERGPDFIPDYRLLLASTGEAAPAELAARFGIDLRQRGFWDHSLKIVTDRIQRYQEF